MKTETQENSGGPGMARRSFLRYAGVGAASVGLLAAASCHKDHAVTLNTGIDIGSGDTGILNFAYALEQLEAAFYIQGNHATPLQRDEHAAEKTAADFYPGSRNFTPEFF